MLISLHLPKTAGSSFYQALERHFGDDLVRDYADMPINRSSLQRNLHAARVGIGYALHRPPNASARCIHGHFLPLKYRFARGLGGRRFVTWLRDPVERVVSHYHYWLRSFDPAEAGLLHRRVVEEQWSLERFCLGPEVQNIYSKFLWGFSLHRFDFVGVTEFYEADLLQFGRQILGADAVITRSNVNPVASGRGYVTDAELRQRLEIHHSQDVALYQQALKMRADRLDSSDEGACGE